MMENYYKNRYSKDCWSLRQKAYKTSAETLVFIPLSAPEFENKVGDFAENITENSWFFSSNRHFSIVRLPSVQLWPTRPIQYGMKDANYQCLF